MLRKLRKSLSLWPVLFIAVGTLAVILYGRGYRPDIKNKDLKSTGLIASTSDPTGAEVFVDGTLKTATNNSFSLDPGWYSIKISKEGYMPWEKKLKVQGEVVTRADAFLFPTNPSLSPVTNSGIENPLLSPDGTKIAYTIPLDNADNNPKKAGLWVYELVERPLGLNRSPRQIAVSDASINFSLSDISWSPDSVKILINIGSTYRLYNSDQVNSFQDITFTVSQTLQDWDQTRKTQNTQKLSVFKKDFVDMATSSAQIISFSPDETKVLYEATASATLPQIIKPALIGSNPIEEQRQIEPGKLYVYDSKEDKNYFLLDKKEIPQSSPDINSKLDTRNANQIQNSNFQKTKLDIGNLKFDIGHSGTAVPVYWFPTSKHLVLALPSKIDIMEYDRTNWITVYSGPFTDNFVIPWPTGSRIIILTNLNPGVSKLPNLYTVNLR